MAEFIPSSPSELTPEWLTHAMREAGALPRGRVVGVEVESLTEAGTGFTGETVRARLTYDAGHHGPPSVVAKFPTGDRQNRGMLEQFDAYAREIRFYRRFAHRMPVPTPAFLGADFDQRGARRTGPRMARLIDALPGRVQLFVTSDVTKFMRATNRRYALLIEDLGPDTAVHDMTAPPDREQLAAALGALARVHAGFWDDPALEGDDLFREVVTNTPGLYQTVGRRRCLDLARSRWHEWLTDDQVALIGDALDRFPADVAAINRKVTMIHGDPRADNILYRTDGEVVLLDWALVAHAHPGWDVGYLLSSALPVERADERRSLVEGYEQGLADAGVEIDDLRAVVQASYRAITVQQLMSIPVLHGSYGTESLADVWMPRLLAGLAQG